VGTTWPRKPAYLRVGSLLGSPGGRGRVDGNKTPEDSQHTRTPKWHTQAHTAGSTHTSVYTVQVPHRPHSHTYPHTKYSRCNVQYMDTHAHWMWSHTSTRTWAHTPVHTCTPCT
jgi:hypothetical protein